MVHKTEERKMPKVELKETIGCLKKYRIEVEHERLEQETSSTVRNLKRSVQLPGFRKGKAPESLIIRRFGTSIRDDALKSLIPKILLEVFESKSIRPANDPEVTDMDYGENSPIAFTVTFEEIPDIDVNVFKGIHVTKDEVAVTDEDVKDEIERLRQMHATRKEINRGAQIGDILIVNLQKLDSTGVPIIGEKIEGHVIYLNESSTPSPEFNEQVLGMKKGDKKHVSLTYDESNNRPKRDDVTDSYEVEILNVLENKIPDLNDDFIATLGDYEDIDDFRAKTRENLAGRFEITAERKLYMDLVENFLKQAPFEVPNSMVEKVIDSEIDRLRVSNQGSSFDESAYRSRLRPDAVRVVQTYVIIKAVKELQKIEVAKEELDERIEALASLNRLKPRELRRNLIKEGNFEDLKNEIASDKAYKWMVNVANVQVVPVEKPSEESRIIKP